MEGNNWFNMHAFNHAPAAMRIFRFAVDTVPRTLEMAHVSKFFRECAIDFDGIGAVLPITLRNEYATGCYFELRGVVKRNGVQCPWLMEKILTRRSVAPIPSQALEPDVTRYDVNWRAEGARRHEDIAVSDDGFMLTLWTDRSNAWAQSGVGVKNGKHYFSVTVTRSKNGWLKVGWVDRKLDLDCSTGPGWNPPVSGAVFTIAGYFDFGTAPMRGPAPQTMEVEGVTRLCTVGCLLNLETGLMTVFADGEPLADQCRYRFPTDRKWYPSVMFYNSPDTLYSNEV